MKSRKILILICFFVTAGFLPDHTQAQNYLSIDDALAIGLENNVGILVARGNAEIAEIQEGLGTAGYLPSLDISGAASKGKSDVTTNSPFSLGTQDRTAYNGQLALNWTLFDGMLMFYNDKRYGKLSEQGKWNLRKTTEDQSVAIINGYYDMVRKSVLLEISREGENISRVRLEQEEIRKNLGGSSTTDYLSAKVTYNNDRLNVLKSRNQLEIARRNLNILLGRAPNTLVEVDTLIPVQSIQFEPDTLIAMAMHNNSGVKIQQYQKNISEIDTDRKYSPFMPRLSANGSYAQSNNEIDSETRGLITQDQNDTQVGLNLSWNLFNGNRDNIGIQTAKIVERNQEILLADVKRRTISQIRNQTETYRNSIEAYEIQVDNVEVAALNLKLFEERYRLGSATFVEYRVALVDYLQSQSTYVDAAFLAKIAEAELKRLSGILIKEVM